MINTLKIQRTAQGWQRRAPGLLRPPHLPSYCRKTSKPENGSEESQDVVWCLFSALCWPPWGQTSPPTHCLLKMAPRRGDPELSSAPHPPRPGSDRRGRQRSPTCCTPTLCRVLGIHLTLRRTLRSECPSHSGRRPWAGHGIVRGRCEIQAKTVWAQHPTLSTSPT